MQKYLLTSLMLIAAIVAVSSCTHSDNDGQVKYVLSDDTPLDTAAAPKLSKGGPVHEMKSRIVDGRLKDIFNDSNHTQLRAAAANGIDPIVDLRSAFYLKRPLVKLHTCKLYYVATMKDSAPYLVPKAANLLKQIATAFADTIVARGGKAYRLRVTSMLRTDYSVAQLQQRNRNATSQSCHRYGTTFDISWSKFDCMDPSYQISQESLKNILAEIIYDFRARGKCYAIFETRQGCFHVTVR
jgi:hypothetical protein